MRTTVLILFAMFMAVQASANSYSTNFPAAQNPLTTDGTSQTQWINGKAQGGNWNNCASSPGFGYGTQISATGNDAYADANCALVGTWGSNQTAQATVAINSPSGKTLNGSVEVELHLNETISSGSDSGYELNCSVNPSNIYAQIVRWNGPVNNFTYLAWANTYCKNGDVLKATRVGSTITFYQNGSEIASVDDSTFLNGSPGMGFYNNGNYPATDNLWYGFRSFSATDGTQTGPSPSVTLTGLPGQSTAIFKASAGSIAACSSESSWILLVVTGAGNYIDSNVTNGQTYCYYVEEEINGILGTPSNILGVTISATGGTGTLLSPPPVMQVINFSGNVVN